MEGFRVCMKTINFQYSGIKHEHGLSSSDMFKNFQPEKRKMDAAPGTFVYLNQEKELVLVRTPY